MIIIKIWLLITCIAIGVFYAQVRFVSDKLKERNPNIKIGGGSLKGKIEALMGSFVLCACPILHIFIIFASIASRDFIVMRAIERIEREMDKEE